jgi:hypothetical protein
MNITVNYIYTEKYLPKRSKNFKYKDIEGSLELEINEINGNEAPIAIITNENRYETGKETYRLFDDSLYIKLLQRDINSKGNNENCTIENFVEMFNNRFKMHSGMSQEEIIYNLKEYADNYIIIDGVVWQKTGEPRYVVMTFGTGHNYGGTSLMISNYYNCNIPNSAYFNALDREKAIQEAKYVAKDRGDTDSINTIGDYNIEVIISEAIQCNPKKDHFEW